MIIKRFSDWLAADSRRCLFILMGASFAITVGVLFSCSAKAASGDLSWQLATQYTDGTPMPAGTVTGTGIRYGICNATATDLLPTPAPATMVVPAPTTAVSINGLGAGTWCFAVRTETAGGPSDYTAFVSKAVVLKPNPPRNLAVTVQTAFMAVRQDNKFVMIPVGTVPASTVCDPDNGVVADGKAYFAVPTSAVSWFGATQPTVAVAPCA